jgi:hypothetical protein
MISKQDKQRLLNKFKFIEKMNGYSGKAWWRDTDCTCQRCQLNFLLNEEGETSKCQNLRKRLCYDFKIDDINEKDHNLNGYEGPACVEFLRRPILKDNLGTKTLDK